MKKKKADSLLKSFNKQKMARLTESKGKSLDYACAVVGGAAGDRVNMNLYTDTCQKSVCIACADSRRDCDESVKICV